MLALRLLLVASGVILIFTLLGYSLNRDPRWLRLAGVVFRGGVALLLIVALLYLAERLLLLL